MKAHLLKAFHVLAVVITISVIVGISAISIVWAELPALKSEKPRLEAYLSQKFSHPVSLGTLSLELHGIHPVLTVDQFDIYSEDRARKLFSVDELSIGQHYISLDGTNLKIKKDKDGYWVPENLAEIMPKTDAPSLLFSRKMIIDVKNIALSFEGVFPQPIYITHGRMRGVINNTVEGFDIDAHHFTLENKDIALWGSAKISSHWLDMHIKFRFDHDVSPHLNHYLPINLLKPALLHWLTASIKKVESGSGVMILQGVPADFPYETKPGKFLIDANFKGMNLHYDPEWPIAQNIDGELIFDRDSMQMQVYSAELLQTPVSGVLAKIPTLNEKAILNLQGEATAPTQQLLQFVLKSPLKKSVGQYLENAQTQGNAHLALILSLPLTPEAGNTKLDAKVTLQQNSVKFPNDMVFDNVQGDLSFNESGVTGNKLSANYVNDLLSVMIKPDNYNINYAQWHVQAQPMKEAWKLEVSHPGLQGVLYYRPQVISGVVRKLVADAFSDQVEKKSVSPEKLPAIKLNILDLRYKNKKFGQVRVETTPTRYGLDLNRLQANLGKTAVNVTGYWKNNNSGIQGSIITHSVKETLANWGIDSGIESGMASLSGQLNWDGKLYSPDLNSMQGRIHLDISKGQILKVSSQAKMDFGRLLTLLSFHSLSRRLKLDFTDLTSRGLSFDSIKGDFVLNDGIASTTNTYIDGELADIQMTGTIDIIHQTYQLKAVVTPDITSSLPVIATIAGGPVAGAAAWAANKLFNPVINKITSDTYTITGTWDKPVIQ